MHVYHLANLLAAAGHRVEVLCSGSAHTYKIRDRRDGDYPHHPGVKIHRIRSPFGRLEVMLTYLFGRPFFTRQKISRVLEKDFDVIHYHNISLFGGVSILKLGRAIKLFTQHTYWLFCPTHYLWKMKERVCKKKECLRCLFSYRRPPQFWRWTGIRDRRLGNVDSLIMPCRYMLKRHREEGFSGRMDCLPYFVEPVTAEIGPPPEKNFQRLKPFFLLVTRLEPYKGPQVAISAFRRKKGEARLVVVGTGSMARELRAAALGDPRIRFLDYVAPERLEWLYANAVALLAPSVWPEMGNLTVLQAQSCGTPVIASAVGLLPELVREHGAGLMFTSEEGLVRAMEVMEDPGRRRSFSEAGRQAYMKEYSAEIFLQRYHRLLADLGAGN